MHDVVSDFEGDWISQLDLLSKKGKRKQRGVSQDTPDRITMVTQIAKKQPWNAIASCAFCDRKNHPACPTVYPRGPDSNAIGVNAAAYRAFHRSFSHERQSNDPKPNMNRKNRLKGELPRY